MTPAVALLMIWAVLAVYSILMAIDLGAGGFWAYGELGGQPALTRVVERYATPVWESVNGFLILLVLSMEAFFPKSINVYAGVLLVPLGLTFALLSIRQAAFAMRHAPPNFLGRRARLVNPLLVGGAGLLTPLPAMTFLTVLEGRGFRLFHGVVQYHLVGLLANPLTVAFMVLALSAELQMAVVFLTFFADRMGEEAAWRTLRRASLVLDLVVAAVAPLALLVLTREVPTIRPALARETWLWLLSLAGLACSFGATALRVRGLLPVVFAAIMYLGGYMALGLAQSPYLIRGFVTVQEAFTSPAMARALGPTFVIGSLVVVLPSVALVTWYLFRSALDRTGSA